MTLLILAVLKEELHRAFCNWRLIVALLAGILIVGLHIITCVIPEASNQELYLTTTGYPLSVHNRWIGGWGGSIFPMLFFSLLPLIVCIPFSDSLYMDCRSGYVAQVVSRASRLSYIGAKYFASFAIGIVASLAPLLFDFYLTALWLPLTAPDSSAGVYPILAYSLFSDLFYDNIVQYYAIYAAVIGVTSGLLACFPLALGFVLPNRGLVTCSSFMICLILYFIFGSGDSAWLVPAIFMRPDQPVWGYSFAQILCFLGGLSLMEGVMLVIEGRRLGLKASE